ncbi:non-ribosomal peptide synthase domain TIGR01720/amino acid adenylation domain-containing protein [Marininema mesophilum]|uniref:Non-ribosomal peptide synthase domain TIGR01720/amino acid adenylation domain-containing protein n=1 Tax=Marininema mesophilum TaxID=1048340 RepID=A0A1H3B178_9BACL|nr:non-ribosomal peptide synthetase [Marininema mesophilum]SDX35692.1 non-ribosomal peptide synthase domain TIGR01720/amino acid adenylation domain-containing protein [Marininema mesophilum]
MAKLDKQNVEDILSLTPTQEGILFHYLKDPESEEYVEQLSIELLGEVNEEHVRGAWESVMQSNEMLRTVFRWEKVKAPVQIVLKEHPLQWTVLDLQGKSEQEKQVLLSEMQRQDRERKFDLGEVPFRITLCKLEKEKNVMIINNHHILYDGWSNGLLLKEFVDAYRCVSQGEAYLPPNKKKYRDFVKYIQEQDKNGQQQFWQEYLAGFDAQTTLLSNESTHGQQGGQERHDLIHLAKEPLDQFAREHEVTLASLIYSVWGTLLQRYNHSQDIIFGTTVSGRSGAFKGIEDLVGLFINTIPLRITAQSGETVAELVRRVNRTLQDRGEVDNTPLSDIKKYSELEEGTNLFDTIVVFENYPLDQALQHGDVSRQGGLTFGSYSTVEKTNYALTLSVTAFDEVEVCFSYNEKLFNPEMMNRLATHFCNIINEMVHHPEQLVSQLEMLAPEEKNQILREFNNTQATIPHPFTVIEQFQQQAANSPDQVAIICEGRELTYRELDRMANNLANALIRKGIHKGEFIGLLTTPSIEMVLGMLAILKGGCAYVPIDPDYPEARKEHIFQDSDVRYLLAQERVAEKSTAVAEAFSANQLLILDDPQWFAGEGCAPNRPWKPSDLFCLFYTSGTTGKPKGVMIANKSVHNLVHWFGKQYEVTDQSHMLMMSSYTVDPSLEDIFATLLHGATLHIAGQDVLLNREAFCDYVEQHQIHLINFIPTVLKELLVHDRKLSSLQTVISGSEKLDDSLKNDLLQKGYTVYNNYGPTENTVEALSLRCSEEKVTLGQPIANVRCYILDQDHHLAPIGVAGEIYIAGAGVSQGYLNLPNLTQEKFLQDPFYPNDRMYRTGDLGKWLPNGQVELIGRMDHQVKIRGYRIELGEIQNQLLLHEHVTDAVVIDHKNDLGKSVLCAYVVGEFLLEEKSLRDFVSVDLPSYMVPSYIMQLDKLPLTSIGKIDREALPVPQMKTGNTYVAPRTVMEKELVQIWSIVLGRDEDQVGVEDNFFELGGDSILSIQIAGKATQKGIQLTVSQMFQHQTITELAQVVQHTGTKKKEERDTPVGEALLTPIQKWFFEQDLQNIHHWNQAILLETRIGTKPEGIRKSFAQLIDYHDSFRLRYDQQDGEWVQAYAETKDHGQCHVYDVSGMTQVVREEKMKGIIDHLQRSLNITEGPLIQAAFFYAGEEAEGRLFITAHHLIVDGYSWRVLMEDLQNLYDQWENHGQLSLPPKTLSFKKWSQYLSDYAHSDVIKDELHYWMEQTSASAALIPVDKEEGPNTEGSAQRISLTMSAEETHHLVYDIHSSFRTRIDDILLAALSATLGEWTGKTLVDLEGHGREKLLEEHDVSRTIGWFTSVFPLILGDADEKEELSRVIQRVKERYRIIPKGGIGYELLYYLADEDLRAQVASKQRAQISFNYLGQLDQRNQRNNGRFTISDVNTGSSRDTENIRSHLLEMDCMIVDGVLTMEWKYSANRHKAETIQRLADNYLAHLQSLIQYCLGREGTYFTPSDFPLATLEQKNLDTWAEQSIAIEDIYSLSPVQQSMVFHHIYSPDSSVTVEQTVFSIQSDLNIDAFAKVWQQIVDRHESMRASYHWKGLKEPVQVIHKGVKVPFHFKDWAHLSEEEGQIKVEQLLEEDRKQGFDLAVAPLMRVFVIKRADALYDVIWTHHHLQLDGWCNSILLKEIGQLYEAYASGASITLAEAIPFKEYIRWYRKQDLNHAEAYWRKSLKGFRTPVRFNSIFPTKVKRASESAFGDVSYDVSLDVQRKMKAFAKQHRITINTMVQGAWAILLNRYSGQEDIVFGATSSGRPTDLDGSEAMIGCFMNTLPFRVAVSEGVDLSSWLQDIQLKQVQMRQFEYTPLADIRSWSETPRNSALYDLYESIVIFENYPFDVALKDGLGSLKVESMRVEEQMDFPLTVYCNLQPDLHFKLLYDLRYVDHGEASRLIGHLVHIIEEMIQGEATTLGEVAMMAKEEVDQLLIGNNDTSMDYPKESCFTDLFAEQVLLRPHHPAVMQGDEQLSYHELDIRSNQLAHRLIQLGVGPDVPVGVYVERSLEMMIGIVGVLKAGGAFLPMDAEYPGERIDMMLEDGQVPVLLTQKRLAARVRHYEGVSLCLDQVGEGDWESILLESKEIPLGRIAPHNLAYIIYTSGSSGKPKGVMMPHEACVSHALDMIKRYQLTAEDRVLQFSSISFDISLEQILSTMAAGATLVLRDKEVWTPYQFSQKCEQYALTLVNLPTSYWGEVAQEWHNRPPIIPRGSLRLIVVGGEQMPPEKVALWEDLPCEHILFLNAYGPAETAMTSTLYHVSGHGKKSADLTFIPVGKPLANRRIYILGEKMELLPAGIKGEICIGGIPLARGYLNKEDLTAEKFVQDPYFKEDRSRLYRTGDLGRLLPDGNIEVLGRKDAQTKVRGHRIDIGEVEVVLNQSQFVRDAVVVVKTDARNEKMLVAFYIPPSPVKKGALFLKENLRQKLPEYMIPSYFIELERFPMSPNGKIDRKELESWEITRDVSKAYESPQNDVQKRLTQIWGKVLGAERVGIHDSFFELGGQSLNAITLISEIHREFEVELPLVKVFESPTVKELAFLIEEGRGQRSHFVSIEPVPIQNVYECSAAQKRMYMVSELSGVSTNYNMPGAVILRGNVDRKRLDEAFKELVQRHDAFRTSFVQSDGQIMQRIYQEVDFTVQHLPEAGADPDHYLGIFVRPFDLTKAPLFRVALVQLSSDNYLLMYDMHHIISDGLSIGILINEFTLLYAGDELPDLKIQYKDFSAWQNREIQSGYLKQQEDFWLQSFSGEVPLLDLPTDFIRSEGVTFAGDEVVFTFDKNVTAQLHGIAREQGTTLYVLLLSAFHVLLYKETGQQDIVVGTPVAGRRHAELENVVGMFVNTLALRNHLSGDMTLAQFVSDVASHIMNALENQDYPFEMLVDRLELKRDLNRNPLFDVMFAFENVDANKVQMRDFEIVPCEMKNHTTKFDLELKVTELHGELTLTLQYRSHLFTKETITRMAGHLQKILRYMVEEIDSTIHSMDILSTREKEQLTQFNDTKVVFPQEKTIKDLFEEQVVQHPHQLAVVSGKQTLTYQALNNRSNQLAHHLIKKGTSPQPVVALMVEPSLEMVVGLWGVIKSGATYLPIDPEFPGERIEYMLHSSGSKILLKQSHVQAPEAFTGEIIDIDDASIFTGSVSNPENRNLPEDLVYIIYTSGTTGRPKGVPIKHQNLVNYQSWFARTAGIQPHDKTILLSSIAFDLGYTSLYSALLNGGELHLAPKGFYVQPQKLLPYLAEHQISYLKLTPSLFNILVNHSSFSEGGRDLSLRLVVLGGEEINLPDLGTFHAKYPEVMWMNHYGPTEATVGAIAHLFDFKDVDQAATRPIIGKPIDNVQVAILDADLNPVPMGVTGEICIAGAGLTEGYIQHDALNREIFVQRPCFGQESLRFYRTGDLGRYTVNGEIQFLGRVDHQLKIRGFRVEPEEVAAVLLRHELVNEAIVVARGKDHFDQQLHAYLVSDEKLDGLQLRQFLSNKLPYYMMPVSFVQLESLPLTLNGKVDVQKLPEPSEESIIEVKFEKPQDAVEQTIAEIWEELLGIEGVGAHDHFFERGGDSLKAMLVISEIHKRLHVNILLREVFKSPTVRELATQIKRASQSIYSELKPVIGHETYALSAAQQRLYTLNYMEGIGTSYNLPRATLLEGVMDTQRLERAFNELVQRHESLRTSFEVVEGEVRQRIHPMAQVNISYINLEQDLITDLTIELDEELRQRIDAFVQPFDLSQAPLLRIGLIRLAQNQYVLLTDMHHLIADGYSIQLLVRELLESYHAKNLPEIGLQYKDFAAWQHGFLQSEVAKEQEEYWLHHLSGELPVLTLPTDFPRPMVQSYAGDRFTFTAGETLKKHLEELCVATDTTLYMVLFAAYSTLLAKYSSQEDIIIGSPVLGRTHADLQQIIGMFVNTLAIRSFPKGDKMFKDLLSEIRDNSLHALENQDYQFDSLIDQLAIKRDPSRNPVFSTLLSLQEEQRPWKGTDSLSLKPIEYRNRISKFDLSLYVEKGEQDLHFELEFASKLFTKDTIQQMAKDYLAILEAITTNPATPLNEIEIEGVIVANTEIEDVIFDF